jgi:hypothetical protein
MRKLLTFLIALGAAVFAVVSPVSAQGFNGGGFNTGLGPFASYLGPGDEITTGWFTWASCAIAFNAASASTSTSACDLVQGSTGASPGTAVGTLRLTAAGTVDLSAYFAGSVTPAAACAAITGGCVSSQQYDQSGNSHPLVQATVANMPPVVFSGLNGLPVLNYPSVKVSSTAATTSAAQPFTFTAVYIRPGTAAGGIIGGSNVTVYLAGATSANKVQINGGIEVDETATDNVWHAVQGQASGSSNNCALNVDGTDTGGLSCSNSGFSSSQISLGRTNAVQLTGSIAAAGVLLATTTPTQRNAVCHVYKTMFALSGATC